MDFLQEFMNKESVKRTLFFTSLVLIVYFNKGLINLLLMTFVFTFIINSFLNFLKLKFNIKNPIIEKLIILSIYTLFGITIFFTVYKYAPIFINQSTAIINQISDIKFNFTSDSESVQKYVNDIIQKIDIKNYVLSGVDATFQMAAKISKITLHIFIAFMLSMFFMLEKRKVMNFAKKFEKSKVSIVYKYFSSFGNTFINTFGKVIQAQIIIALANTIISIAFLFVMGFPKLVSLAIMIYVLSLIPVAGVIISLVPLCLIAFKIGGMSKIISVILMIIVVHAFESYVLNPKLMSAKIELPIFVTFLILFVSEHFLGVWGLLIGIPIVMFILDLLDVKLTK